MSCTVVHTPCTVVHMPCTVVYTSCTFVWKGDGLEVGVHLLAFGWSGLCLCPDQGHCAVLVGQYT